MEKITILANTQILGQVFPQAPQEEDEIVHILSAKERIENAILRFLWQQTHAWELRQYQKSVVSTDDDSIAVTGE